MSSTALNATFFVHKDHMAMVGLTASSKRISFTLTNGDLDGISWINAHGADPILHENDSHLVWSCYGGFCLNSQDQLECARS